MPQVKCRLRHLTLFILLSLQNNPTETRQLPLCSFYGGGKQGTEVKGLAQSHVTSRQGI